MKGVEGLLVLIPHLHAEIEGDAARGTRSFAVEVVARIRGSGEVTFPGHGGVQDEPYVDALRFALDWFRNNLSAGKNEGG